MNEINAKWLLRNEVAKEWFRQDDMRTRSKDAWALCYINAERPIPEKLRSDFYEELVSENLEYRKALEESIRWFGVRWTT